MTYKVPMRQLQPHRRPRDGVIGQIAGKSRPPRRTVPQVSLSVKPLHCVRVSGPGAAAPQTACDGRHRWTVTKCVVRLQKGPTVAALEPCACAQLLGQHSGLRVTPCTTKA